MAIKIILVFFSTFIPLVAREANEKELESIYNEAILFVVVFSIMSVVSIIISKRQAKKYTKESSLEEKSDNIENEIISKNENRLIDLRKLVNKGLLKKEEFEILKRAM